MTDAKHLKSVFFFEHGQVVPFDMKGEQVSEIQREFWHITALTRMATMGYDLTGCEVLIRGGLIEPDASELLRAHSKKTP